MTAPIRANARADRPANPAICAPSVAGLPPAPPVARARRA